MRQKFIAQLLDLNNNVIKMGSILEVSTNEVILALKNTDVKKAEEIINRDDEIDLLELQIEKDCINLIAKQQPLASDLRKVTSIMKIITDIERIADQCADISEYIIKLNGLKKMNVPPHILDMVEQVKVMVVDTIDSFVNEDIKKAEYVIAQDDVVDQYFETITEELITLIKNNTEYVDQCMYYLMIAKYLERMADHSTNIAEWIIFIITGNLALG